MNELINLDLALTDFRECQLFSLRKKDSSYSTRLIRRYPTCCLEWMPFESEISEAIDLAWFYEEHFYVDIGKETICPYSYSTDHTDEQRQALPSLPQVLPVLLEDVVRTKYTSLRDLVRRLGQKSSSGSALARKSMALNDLFWDIPPPDSLPALKMKDFGPDPVVDKFQYAYSSLKDKCFRFNLLLFSERQVCLLNVPILYCWYEAYNLSV